MRLGVKVDLKKQYKEAEINGKKVIRKLLQALRKLLQALRKPLR
jgi:hypothetical protein